MGFYEEYLSFKKKEKIYFTGSNLSEFNNILDSLKDKLILNGLVEPSAKRFKFEVKNVDGEYDNLFILLNKYTSSTNATKYILKTALENDILDYLNYNDNVSDSDIVSGFRVEVDLIPNTITTDLIESFVIYVYC